jgi:hypothetical protein
VGTFLNITRQNDGLIIRNNEFIEPDCSTWVVDCSSGGEDPDEYCRNVEIYGNTFRTNCPEALHLEATQNARIYNNVFEGLSGARHGIEVIHGEQESSGVWVYNNTIIAGASGDTFANFADGTDHALYNNLFVIENSSMQIAAGSCEQFGDDGSTVRNNYVYFTGGGDLSGPLDCGNAAGNASGEEPGFADPESSDFHITSESPAYGFGDPNDAPPSDFDGEARPNPPSAGAFDVPD